MSIASRDDHEQEDTSEVHRTRSKIHICMAVARGWTKREQEILVVNVTERRDELFRRFGFRTDPGGAHTSRTMMLEELRALLANVDSLDANKADYLRAIDEENCLGKRSGKSRRLACRHLVDLYSLDSSLLIYRALLFFWLREPDGQPLLALLSTYARDLILRPTASFILAFPEGATVTSDALEEFIDEREPGRFSKATLQSTVRNLRSTWTQSGHLTGHRHKVRTGPAATPGSVSYALLLGYLTGVRGKSLFKTEYSELLDCPLEIAIGLAEDASRKGWIVFKRVGDVIEVLFPNLINEQEMEWLREQS